jgi:hypothetical protein
MFPGYRIAHNSALLIISIVATPAWAALDETYKLTMGGSLTSYDSKIRINSRDDSIDNEIDFESDLGFDSELRFGWVKGIWRMADRHRLSLLYLPTKRTSGTTTHKDLDIGGNIIKSGAFINASVKTDVFDIEYLYSFYKHPNIELGVNLGVYWMNSLTELTAAGEIIIEGSNQPEYRTDYRSNQRLSAPLPLIGVTLDYEINPKWRTKASARYLDVTISDIEGRILSLNLGTEYYLTKQLGIGAALNLFELSVQQNGIVFFNTLEYAYSGISAYLSLKY